MYLRLWTAKKTAHVFIPVPRIREVRVPGVVPGTRTWSSVQVRVPGIASRYAYQQSRPGMHELQECN